MRIRITLSLVVIAFSVGFVCVMWGVLNNAIEGDKEKYSSKQISNDSIINNDIESSNNVHSGISDRCKTVIPLLSGSENPSRFAAQIEQESSCNPYAMSRTGAEGLAQIMPDTLKWGSRSFARHLGTPRPLDPRYAVEFMKSYMAYFTVDLFEGYCSNKFVDELRYNGGYYVIWELKQAKLSFEKAMKICGNVILENGKRRSPSNCVENYNYAKHISRRQEKYLFLGGVNCPFNIY